jgi:Coenzyme PQQ synthesis protein D (PqqD)
MSGMNIGIGSGVIDYELDDETVLFIEDSGELVRLNTTASLVWRGLQSGVPSRDIVDVLVQASGARHNDVQRDVEGLILGLQRIGALVPSFRNAAFRTALLSPSASHAVCHPKRVFAHANSHERCYRVLDFRFRIKTPSNFLDLETHQLLARFAAHNDPRSSVALEVIQERDHWLLLCEGELVDRTATQAGVVPMLHANILMMAYANSDGMAVVHAAAVTRRGRCVLLPAVSGNGKSTLTAALVSSGFDYFSDDLVMLTREPVQIRAVPTCVGLKSGSWKAVDHLFPQLSQLTVYHRNDNKEIKYLSLPTTGVDALSAAHAIVFPTWMPDTILEFRKIGSADALARLTSAGYDLPKRLNRDIVECLIRWIGGLPCFELRYCRLDDAIQSISTLIP